MLRSAIYDSGAVKRSSETRATAWIAVFPGLFRPGPREDQTFALVSIPLIGRPAVCYSGLGWGGYMRLLLLALLVGCDTPGRSQNFSEDDPVVGEADLATPPDMAERPYPAGPYGNKTG